MADYISYKTQNDCFEQYAYEDTVDNLISKWYNDVDIPTNDDRVIECVLNGMPLYFRTFGDLMVTLTGDDLTYRGKRRTV